MSLTFLPNFSANFPLLLAEKKTINHATIITPAVIATMRGQLKGAVGGEAAGVAGVEAAGIAGVETAGVADGETDGVAGV